jgi:ABC-type molybdate transport system substrate-binding protein
LPQLLKVLVDAKDPAAELAVTKSLVAMKRLAVAPIGLALNSLDPVSQRKAVGILAEIGWPTALPFIVDLASRPSTTVEVKAACDAAFNQLGGTTRDVTAQYTALARKYFDRESSLVPYADDAVNNLWSHDDASGFGSLAAEQVATAVYCESMAMVLARRALAADAGNVSALAIFVASDLRRENTLGSDFKAGRYSPQFFATASGPTICSEVLGMAIDARDSALIRDAIAVLSQTAGGNALVSSGGRMPILEALSFSDRRVRVDAALALAASAPTQSFAGDFRVVPTLASAVGDTSAVRTAVLGGSNDDRRATTERLSKAGFAAIASGASFADLENGVVRAEGVDLVVVSGGSADLAKHVASVRASGLTAATPVVVMCAALEEAAVRKSFSGDRSVMVWSESAPADSFASAANAALASMSGGAMSDDEATAYAAAAASALRSIAASNSKTFSIADAEPALLRALSTKSGGLRLMIADVLSVSKSATAQRALVDAALASSGEEQVALCDFAAQASRMTGAKADGRQMAALRELIGSSEGAVADAAGRLYGSLDGGSTEAVKLITGK